MNSGFGNSMAGQAGMIQRARVLLDAAEYETAISLLREMLEKEPKNAMVLRLLGYALMLFDHMNEAVRHLEFSNKLSPGDPGTLCDLAMTYRRLDRLGDAHKVLDEVLRDDPGHGRAVALKARVLQSRGQSAQAMVIVEKALAVSQDPSIVMIFGNLSRELKKQGPAIDVIEKTLENSSLERVKRIDLLFSLGHLYDSVKEYDKAFVSFDMGNKMTDVGQAMNFENHLADWSKEAIDGFSVQPVDGSRSVLVVGMPRSGTTLTEQILGAHPQAGGIGESPVMNEIFGGKVIAALDDQYLANGGRRYLESLDAAYSEGKILRVIDKMPENYLFLGLIEKMLPGVRVVHCRRDARDTCLSIYFQRFGPGIRYGQDLGTCAQQYLGYLKTMEHWEGVLDVPVFESRYESLTSGPEPHVRAMLDYVGLEFHRSCLEHHKSKSSVHTASAGQVRQPLYKSSQARWKNYEKHLGPMLEVLGDVE